MPFARGEIVISRLLKRAAAQPQFAFSGKSAWGRLTPFAKPISPSATTLLPPEYAGNVWAGSTDLRPTLHASACAASFPFAPERQSTMRPCHVPRMVRRTKTFYTKGSPLKARAPHPRRILSSACCRRRKKSLDSHEGCASGDLEGIFLFSSLLVIKFFDSAFSDTIYAREGLIAINDGTTRLTAPSGRRPGVPFSDVLRSPSVASRKRWTERVRQPG